MQCELQNRKELSLEEKTKTFNVPARKISTQLTQVHSNPVFFVFNSSVFPIIYFDSASHDKHKHFILASTEKAQTDMYQK